MKTSDLLKQAKTLISKPENWTTGFCARNSDGNGIPYTSDEAVCFCSLGAAGRIASMYNHAFGFDEAYSQMRDYLMVAVPYDVPDFNDTHSHIEVMELWDKAIALAEKDEAAN